MTHPTIDVLLLDADGVIQDIDEFPLRMTALLQGRATLPELLAVESTAITGHTDLTADLARFLTERGISSTPEELHAVWRGTRPLPGVLELIDRVRAAGVRVYLATNQQPVRGLFIQESLGYSRRFDGEFYSFEMGVAKPDPAFYTHICKELGIEPSRVFFVDDLLPNVEGARQAGVRAGHLPRQDPLPGHHVGPAAGAAALEELLVANGIPTSPPEGG